MLLLSFVPPVSAPAADGVITGFDVLSVGDDLCATVFGFINIAKCPGVFERCAGGLAADGGGIITVRIEWRIEIDKIDAIAIHPSHDGEVVPDEICFVFPVHFDFSLTKINSF